MTDEELAAAEEEIRDVFAEVREALAEELGGDPDDYQSDQSHRPEADGGERA